MASEIPCPSCGALISPDAGACDLCGHTLAGSDDDADPPAETSASSPAPASSSEEEAPPEEELVEDAPAPAANGAVYCTECGTAFAPGDKFCSQCGTPRASSEDAAAEDAAAEDAAAAGGTRPVAAALPTGASAPESDDGGSGGADDAIDESAINRKLMWLVGGAVVVVAALFLGTLFSERGGDPLARTAAERNAGDDIGTEQGESAPQGPFQGGSSSQGGEGQQEGQQAAPVSVDALVDRYSDEQSDDVAAQVDSLRGEMEEEDDLIRQTLQQEVINVYMNNGQLGRAAQEQKAIAEDADDPDAWRRTGDLLYSWMEQLGQNGTNEAIAQIAPHVVEAYEAVLDEEPDNLDVRTDMATALLQTQSPMRGVEEINRVIEEDPEHFQARFNKGIMQLYIGRVDEAVAEFEEVKRIVGEDSPYYDRADRAIELAREEEERAREEGGAPSEGMPTPAPEAGDSDDEAPAFPNP
ncbi:MAG: zinc ribbon domain-containing protein [Longimonas sp.]